LRWELTVEMADALKAGAALAVGIDHPEYQAKLDVPAAIRAALVMDLK
jgi:glycerol-3-phosphate dehydrogenase subunit C